MDGFQPIVLKASSTPTDFAPEVSALSVCAVIAEALAAVTATSPVAVSPAWSTSAAAPLRTRLVAIAPPAASEVPWPVNVLPPDEEPVTSVSASTVAASVALTVTDAAVTLRLRSVAWTSLRRSLSTTAPPMPVESELVKLMPCGTSSVPSTGFHRPRSVKSAAARSTGPSTPIHA